MRLKLVTIIVYAAGIALPATLFAQAQSSSAGQPASAGVIKLDVNGVRGIVAFNHSAHATRVNPDPNAPFKTKPGAACDGCHHTYDKFTGAPQLWRCDGCHRNSGDPANPRGRDYDEEWSKTASHNLCIGCHIASKKGPVKCADCHQAGGQEARGRFRFGTSPAIVGVIPARLAASWIGAPSGRGGQFASPAWTERSQ